MENENTNDKNSKILIESIKGYNLTESEMEVMTVEDFINHIYHLKVKI
jgi:hypothetical protein